MKEKPATLEYERKEPFKTPWNRTKTILYTRVGLRKVVTAGYVPFKDRIANIIASGQALQDYREELYPDLLALRELGDDEDWEDLDEITIMQRGEAARERIKARNRAEREKQREAKRAPKAPIQEQESEKEPKGEELPKSKVKQPKKQAEFDEEV